MRPEIVHYDDVSGMENGDEHFLDIEPEPLAVDRTVDQPRRVNAISPKRCDECHRVPVAERGLLFQPMSACSPSSERRHVGLDPGFIDENKPIRVDPVPRGDPLATPTRHVRAILLDGDQRLFL